MSSFFLETKGNSTSFAECHQPGMGRFSPTGMKIHPVQKQPRALETPAERVIQLRTITRVVIFHAYRRSVCLLKCSQAPGDSSGSGRAISQARLASLASSSWRVGAYQPSFPYYLCRVCPATTGELAQSCRGRALSALSRLQSPQCASTSIGVTGSISSQKKLPQKYTAAET